MKNSEKEISKKILKNFRKNQKNNFQKINYKNFQKRIPLDIVYENKISKKFRDFQIKREAYHNMQWYANE